MSAEKPRRDWLRVTLALLSGAPNGLASGEVVARLIEHYPPPSEHQVNDPERSPVTYRWDAAALLHVGWMQRQGKDWLITDDGRRALAEYPEAEKLHDAALSVMP